MQSIKTGILGVLSAGLVSAKVTEYKPGHLIEDSIDVGGHWFLDFLAASPEFIFLMLLIGALLTFKWLIKKKRR